MTIEQFHSAFPDWTDKSQYPDPDEFSLSQWAWEFLRRNPKYQSDFATLELETDQGVRNRRSLQTGTAYGLNRPMIDPRIPAIKLQDRIFQDGTPRIIGVSIQPFQLSAFQAAVVIDLRLPIEAQIDLAKSPLYEEQFRFDMTKKQAEVEAEPGKLYKRAHPGKYSEYLRVLDARRTEGNTYRQIAKTIFPFLADAKNEGEERARDAYKAAVALRDGDYRFLPMFSIPAIDEDLILLCQISSQANAERIVPCFL